MSATVVTVPVSSVCYAFVLLGHKHVTLATAQALPGSVIDVDWYPAGAVHLAVRSRIVGERRLVEIERKPGVQILTTGGQCGDGAARRR